jgi:hypothetical protein
LSAAIVAVSARRSRSSAATAAESSMRRKTPSRPLPSRDTTLQDDDRVGAVDAGPHAIKRPTASPTFPEVRICLEVE